MPFTKLWNSVSSLAFPERGPPGALTAEALALKNEAVAAASQAQAAAALVASMMARFTHVIRFDPKGGFVNLYATLALCLSTAGGLASGVDKVKVEVGPGTVELTTLVTVPPHVTLAGGGKGCTYIRNNGARNTAIANPGDPGYNNATIVMQSSSTLQDLTVWTTGEYAHDTLRGHNASGCILSNVYINFPGGGATAIPAGYGRARCIKWTGVWVTLLMFAVLTNRWTDWEDFDVAHGMTGGVPTIRRNNDESILVRRDDVAFGIADWHCWGGCFFDDYGSNAANNTVLRAQGIQDGHLRETTVRNGGGSASPSAICERSSLVPAQTGRGWMVFAGVAYAGSCRIEMRGPVDVNLSGTKPFLTFDGPGGIVYDKGVGPLTRIYRAASGFSWVRQANAVLVNRSDGPLRFIKPGTVGAIDLGIATQAAPSANWQMVAELDTCFNYDLPFLSYGICARNPVSGRIITFSIELGNGGAFLVKDYANPTTFTANIVAPVKFTGTAPTMILEYVTGTLRFKFRKEQAEYDLFHTITGLSGFTELGLYAEANNQNAPARPVQFEIADLFIGAAA